MGVKSHSSSIEDAQADRARRKADREGLRREVQPEEPAAPAKKAAAKKAAATARLTGANEADDADGKGTPSGSTAIDGSPGTDDVGGPAPARSTPIKRTGARLVTSRPAAERPAATPPNPAGVSPGRSPLPTPPRLSSPPAP